MATNISVNVANFNCQGIINNIHYVDTLLKYDCDIMFVCETWLKPCELSTFRSDLQGMQRWCNLKSSTPADTVLEGRPFGGVGFICSRIPNCHYIIYLGRFIRKSAKNN